MKAASASRASSRRRPCRSISRWMLQCPLRSLRVTSRPTPGRRKLSASSTSSSVLASNSSLMRLVQHPLVVQLLLHRDRRRLVGRDAARAARARSGCTSPAARANRLRSASAWRWASRSAASRLGGARAAARPAVAGSAAGPAGSWLSRHDHATARSGRGRPIDRSSRPLQQPALGHREAAPGATITWSSTRTSTSASAAFSVCVSASSAREGCTVPLGWLCASTTEAAWCCSAAQDDSRAGRPTVCVSVPRNISSRAISRFCASRNMTANTSCGWRARCSCR